jgi:8-oxo-dGTP pyrophosphatase MutT (NUDIX family)
MSSIAAPVAQIQYAALPWRKVDSMLQILLITTRNTKRWIVPKGWPLEGHSPQESAAQEALEEAGVLGEVAAKPLGWFTYDKLRKSGEVVPCKVQVYPMEVLRQRRNWAEKAARQTRWCSAEEALGHVAELGLRQLISKFAREAAVIGNAVRRHC